jgi:tRNA (Thr-GGU) A37 N-methylase
MWESIEIVELLFGLLKLLPNPIGTAVLPIEKIENGTVTVRGLDCLNNTPLLDIKPANYREKG